MKPRRPASARPKPAPAGGEDPKALEPMPTHEDDSVPDDDEESWLFSVKESMTTEEIAKMGFTAVILLNAARWRDGEGSVEKAAVSAAADMHYCFGIQGPAFEVLSSVKKAEIEDQLVDALCGRGDLLIVIQNVGAGDVASEAGAVMVGRVVDCIETAYSRASNDMVEDLAGVSVVLERCTLPMLSVAWDDGSTRALEVTAQ
eukprot:CAMPEP_0180129148 /NCGR_PEP_ID=MMETSP0986-20121125/7159_1 /TAXON_ID=697907 /ORGANISM="non described non described, Strain CCMP2293" /LENGTH=201 /DNA_ID=CAMNT_0022068793 /DNA_START=256 /DNA_END=861 /DNA_ORIENTATION=-